MTAEKDKPISREEFQKLMMQQAQKIAERDGIPLTQAMRELIARMEENRLQKK